MGKRKTSAYYTQKATQAKARENYYATRPPRPRAGNTIKERNNSTMIYRSLFEFWTTVPGDTASNDHLPYKVEVDNDAAAKVPATSVGLLATNTTTINTSLAKSTKNLLSPSRATWFSGAATPAVVTTAYNTSWIRYYEPATGTAQSHFSMPITKAAGSFTAADVFATYNTIFGGAQKLTLLGAKNGSSELRLEYSTRSNRIGT